MLPEAAGRRQLLKPKVHAYNLVPFFSLSLKPLKMCGKGKKFPRTYHAHITVRWAGTGARIRLQDWLLCPLEKIKDYMYIHLLLFYQNW